MMVAGCPKCSTRYRVDVERIGPEGAKLRCTKCAAVFLVRAPQAPVEATPAPLVSATLPVRKRAEMASEPPLDSASEPMPEYDSARLVIIADPDEARGKASAEAITNWGLDAYLVQDGVEAMLAIQRMLPSVVVLDAGLPKMLGFQVCEVVKRNESLQDTVVVLVGAAPNQDRYGRNPSDLYGADVYIEQPDLPEGLKPILREHGLPFEGEPESPEAAPTQLPTQAPIPTPAAMPAPVQADEDPKKTEERERALRLARIAVSEMLLYQPEKFEKATKDGNLEQMLDLEIQEARALLLQRIGEEVRAETDFIMDELNRVAAERSDEEG